MATTKLRALNSERLEAAIAAPDQHPLLLCRVSPASYEADFYEGFIRDVLALANMHAHGRRYILFGITPEQQRVSLAASDHVIVKQCTELLTHSIEPPLHLHYRPWQSGSKTLGMLTIDACDNPPYLARTTVGAVQAGDGWIKSGDHVRRLMRRDLDRYFARRHAEAEFNGNASVLFQTSPPTEIIRLFPTPLDDPPSIRAANQLKAMIAAQEAVDGADIQVTSIQRMSFARVFGSEKPYEAKGIDTLKLELEELSVRFAQRDRHYKFEHQSHRMNLQLQVSGSVQILAASLILHLPSDVGIEIATALAAPESDAHATAQSDVCIETSSASIRISKAFDRLRPGTTLAFQEPLRVYLDVSAAGYKIPVRYELRGRNLRRPVTGKLYIVCPKRPGSIDAPPLTLVP